MNPTLSKIELDAEEKTVIIAELKRLRAEPRPFNPRPVGCAVFLLAGALFLLIPQLTKWVGADLPPPWNTIVGGVLVVALAGGLFVGVFAGNGVYGRASVRATASLEWLASHPGVIEAVERRKHAVSLVFNALVSDGPTLSSTVTPAQARERLGENLPYVVAVERVLADEKLAEVYFGRE